MGAWRCAGRLLVWAAAAVGALLLAACVLLGGIYLGVRVAAWAMGE